MNDGILKIGLCAGSGATGAGDLTATEVVVTCPWEAQSMPIMDLLMSQRRWGRTRCRKFLTSIQMSETKSIGSLTERQRRTLAALLSVKGRADDAQYQAEVGLGYFARV